MEQRRIDEIGTVFNGKTPSKADQRHEGFPVLKIKDVDAGGRFRGNFESFVDTAFADKFKSKQLAFGDTLILNAAHNADYVGSKTFFASESLGGPVITGEWTVVRPDPVKADPRYVRYYLESGRARHSLRQMVKGIHLYPKDVARCGIPLPPLPEQRRIAAILDKADALRQKRREAIAKLDQLLQSVFLEMFGDPVTNPKNWPVKKLGDICDQDDRINYGVVQPGTEFEGGTPLIRVGDLVGGELNDCAVKRIDPQIERAYKRSRLRGNELLISCVGSIGIVADAPNSATGWNIARAVTRVPLANPSHRPFYREALRTRAVQRFFREKTRTVSQPTLNIGFVKETLVYEPPHASIEKFCQVSEMFSHLKMAHLRAQERQLKLRLSLQQRAFTGQL